MKPCGNGQKFEYPLMLEVGLGHIGIMAQPLVPKRCLRLHHPLLMLLLKVSPAKINQRELHTPIQIFIRIGEVFHRKGGLPGLANSRRGVYRSQMKMGCFRKWIKL